MRTGVFLACPLLAVVVVLAAGLAGCGREDDSQTYSVVADTTVTTASIPNEGYVSRLNRICEQAWATILDNFAQYSSWQEPRVPKRKRFEEAVRLSLIAGITFHIFDNIYNLGAPAGEEREVEEIIGSLQSASERGEKKMAPLFSVAQVVDLYEEYNERARRYGLDECLVDEQRLKALRGDRQRRPGSA